jgi:uncharacterized membrane protein YhdT
MLQDFKSLRFCSIFMGFVNIYLNKLLYCHFDIGSYPVISNTFGFPLWFRVAALAKPAVGMTSP